MTNRRGAPAIRDSTFRVQNSIRPALLAWYEAQKRALPWRRSRDPYRVWVAEVMLQQTRIPVVMPAYRRFLRAFPTMARLAAANEEQVLSLWSGLGYYTRARALHRAARLLRQRGETFPRDYDEALRLPGVGPYTAAAVLSIAHGEPHAAVDGNVVRVLSRLARLPRPDGRGEPHTSLARELLDRARPGDWNQAMMELGETICLPRTPRCGECPLRRCCQARRHGEVDLHPPPKPRRAAERVDLDLTVVRDSRGRVLLERGAFPHLKHLWLPLLEVVAPSPPATKHRRPARLEGGAPSPPGTKHRRPARLEGGARSSQGADDAPPHTFRHAILHREFDVRVTAQTVAAADMRHLLRSTNGAERRLFTPAEIGAIGRSSLLTKALAHAGTQHS